MAYNPNQSNSTQSYAPKAPEVVQKAKEEVATRRPVGSLHMQGKDEEKKTRITGLFKEVSKNGAVYYRGGTEDGTRYIIFLD